MIRLFAGYDQREAIGYHTFCESVIRYTSEPVAFIPLSGPQKDGTNAFTYARFEVPKLCGYEGWAIFADGCDMVCRSDISELWAMKDGRKAVLVVQHDYQTKHPRKYVGTPMEANNYNYPRKNWSSLMLINCAHPAWQEVDHCPHRFRWLPDSEIGSLPMEWNWLADEQGENANAKLLHWTAGIPAFEHYKDAPMADVWRAHADFA